MISGSVRFINRYFRRDGVSDHDVYDLARHDDDLFRGFAFEPFLRLGGRDDVGRISAGVIEAAYSFRKRSLPLTDTGYSNEFRTRCVSSQTG